MILHVWDFIRVKDSKGTWQTGLVTNISALITPTCTQPGSTLKVPFNVLEADLDKEVICFRVEFSQDPYGARDIYPNEVTTARPEPDVEFASDVTKIVGPDAEQLSRVRFTDYRVKINGNGEPQVTHETH